MRVLMIESGRIPHASTVHVALAFSGFMDGRDLELFALVRDPLAPDREPFALGWAYGNRCRFERVQDNPALLNDLDAVVVVHDGADPNVKSLVRGAVQRGVKVYVWGVKQGRGQHVTAA